MWVHAASSALSSDSGDGEKPTLSKSSADFVSFRYDSKCLSKSPRIVRNSSSRGARWSACCQAHAILSSGVPGCSVKMRAANTRAAST